MGVGVKRLSGSEQVRKDYISTRYNSVTPGYFKAMGISLMQGEKVMGAHRLLTIDEEEVYENVERIKRKIES